MRIKVVIFDMDGVVYRGNTMIKSADMAIKKLKEQGIHAVYLTNAGTRSRKARAEKLRSFGIEVDDKDVFTTSYAAARYVSSNYPKSKQNAFYIGGEGIREELENAGVSLADCDNADVVIVGLDTKLTYEKLALAFKAIIHGADFIATNTDATYPVEDGELLPGAGAVVSFLEFSTGKKPIVIGKPNTYILDIILKELAVKREHVIIVGDRLESDILLGKNAGIKTVLVLSGITKKDDLKKLKKSEMPDYVIDSIADLSSIL